MFLQQYNPWGKMKREQLQSWNILLFDPKNTDVDEHIDLINKLGDMVDQKEEPKMEKFIETIPTMIQTHLIICVTQLRSGEDPELQNTLKNASYRGGRAAKCFKYSPTEGDGGVRAIRSSPG